MVCNISIGTLEAKRIVAEAISSQIHKSVTPDDIRFEVKSTQNWKAEWEVADFRAVYKGEPF